MSILFDAHDDPTQPQHHSRKGRSGNSDDRYSSSQPVDKFNDILVFGYQCKLFRDDDVANDVNSGKFLIPWMGNKDLMIDRYDCRGHLYRMEEFDFEKMGNFTPLSPERLDIESVCDEERYMDLRKPTTSEEEILQEEEDKRGSALYDPFTAYQSIEYSYETTDTNSNKTNHESGFDDETYMQFCQYYGYDPKDQSIRTYFQSQSSYQYDYDRPPPPSEPHPTKAPEEDLKKPSETTYEKFEPPEGITIPSTMEVPETKKMQAIIEKTAMFISKQSAQMEIVLKTKQSGNPQFAFLDFDNYLNPYYKFILTKIKEGEYKFEDDKSEENSKQEEDKNTDQKESDDDSEEDGDENELHPLLQAHLRPVNTTAPLSPIKPSKDSESEPIINSIPQTKTTGKIEDLAKVYMTFKYTQNQNESKDEKEKDGDDGNSSLEEVSELPPPPLPPPPSFVLSQQHDLNSSEDNSVEPTSAHDHQMLLSQPIDHNSPQMIEPSYNIRPRFDSPILGQPPPHSLFSQVRYQQPQLGQPPPFYNFNSNTIPPSNVMNNPFHPMPNPIHYSHPPNMYTVRSSVPPPPPPPLPSLLPPGVDALPISSANTEFTLETSKENQTSENSNLEVYNSQSGPSGQNSLLPPGVDMDTNSDKLGVPPPPLPPILPSINQIKQSITTTEFDEKITDISVVKDDGIKDDNDTHSSSKSLEYSNDSSPKESKKRRKSSKIHNSYNADLQTSEFSQSDKPSSSTTTADNSTIPFPTKIVTPGKDLQLVIDRLALYVAKNGDEFEVGIKEKKDPRFDFLNPWNIYHPYYANKKSVNLHQVTVEKSEDESKKNSKVKFGLKLKSKPVSVGQKKSANATASVFNQNDDEEEMADDAGEGFQPNKDPEVEVKRKLQKQIEEKEKLLKQLQEQALLQQKIAEVNRQASSKPMLQHLTAEQQALLKKKVQENEHLKKDNDTNVKQDERKKRVASFVGMLKKNSSDTEQQEPNNLAGNFLRKRQFKETSGSKDSNTVTTDRANYEKKKDAFFKAINDAFKGT